MKKITLLLYFCLLLGVAVIGEAKAANGTCYVGGPVTTANKKYIDTELPTRVKVSVSANCKFVHKGNSTIPFTNHLVEFEILRTDMQTPTEWVVLMSALRKELEKECQEQGCNN